jgi:dTDP-4-amino-4,6-dideoxygalactose transaminase
MFNKRNSKKFDWPLCADAFTFWDKLKISKFLFTEKIWTYGKWVEKYENMWSELLGGTHSIMVSSGSAANELIALRRKWELQQTGEWPKKNKVVAPCNTWISSVSVWINAGYEVVFTDVASRNLNMTSDHLREIFAKDKNKEIGTVFYTALLGFYGDIAECKRLTEEHGAKFLMDNCEATYSLHDEYIGHDPDWLLNFSTCSTSLYFSHFSVSGTEGGMIYCKDQEEADFYRMMRSHGLTRGMPNKYKNPEVSADFDFALLGSNYRSSNLQAFMASLDFDRGRNYSLKERAKIYNALTGNLRRDRYRTIKLLSDSYYTAVCPLAIPIICLNKSHREVVELFCRLNGVQTRPIIGGCLLAHTAFKGYGNTKDFPVAMNSHECGLYIGINKNVTEEMAVRLANELNKL